MADDLSKALAQRHPTWNENEYLWRYFRDHYTGGVLWASKPNPVPVQGVGSPSAGDLFTTSAPKTQSFRYLWKFPLERPEKYRHRMERAIYVNLIQPVVDFYCSTVGKSDNVTYTPDPNFAEFEDNADLQGKSFLQFMQAARIHATTAGHTFLIVDSTKAADGTAINTVADQIAAGIRPYVSEVLAEDMLNWRLDATGKPIEVLYRVQGEVPGGVMDIGDQVPSVEYRYWNAQEWRIYKQMGTGKKATFTLDSEGTHKLGRVPIVVLYHKWASPFLGESLLKDAAKIAQLVSNWCSALDESLETQMFAIPCWKSKKTPTDAGVGSSSVLHLNPDEGEDFFYRTPETGPFQEGWEAFYRMIQLANKHMGITPKAITGDKGPDTQSGISKQWDFFESEKVLSRMAGNEQDAADEVFLLVGLWMGKEFKGSIQYVTTFDLATAQDDINDLISLQSAGLPATARQELMRLAVFKKMPNLTDALQTKINKEIDAIGEYVDPALMPAPGDPAGGGGTQPKPLSRPVDRSGRSLVAAGDKNAVAA